MKIMSFLNISNPDNIATDSGWIFQKALGRSLMHIGHDFLLVSYSTGKPIDIDDERIKISVDKFSVRYGFDWVGATKTINDWQPDIILSNQPELSSNLRACFISNSLDIKLYTYIHYFPFFFEQGQLKFDPSLNNFDFCKSITLSFISGIVASDRIFLHSVFALEQLELLFKYFGQTYSSINVTILPPPFDKYIAKTKAIEQDGNSILYNHRLYKQYGTDQLISFAKSVSRTRDWKIVITDLLFNKSDVRKQLDQSPSEFREMLTSLPNVLIRTDGNQRSIYREIIYSSRIALAPYRINCPWSMSVVDCMSAGLPVLAPRLAWFKEFIPQELTYETLEQKIQLIDNLFLDKSFYADMSAKVFEKVVNNEILYESSTATIFLS